MQQTDLACLHCQTCNKQENRLSENLVTEYLNCLQPAWTLTAETQQISRAFQFGNYYETMAFANVVAQIAHQQDHHPDLHIRYNCCTVSYSTHSINGLSANDFICAAKINAALIL